MALLVPRDAQHERAMAWSRSLLHDTLLVSEPILFETLAALATPPARLVAIGLLSRIQRGGGITFVPMDDDLRVRAARLYEERADKAWSLADCVSFLLMRDRGITRALTHDHHFEQAGFEAMLRRDP